MCGHYIIGAAHLANRFHPLCIQVKRSNLHSSAGALVPVQDASLFLFFTHYSCCRGINRLVACRTKPLWLFSWIVIQNTHARIRPKPQRVKRLHGFGNQTKGTFQTLFIYPHWASLSISLQKTYGNVRSKLNELPADIRTAESLTSFRRRLKTHLFRVHVDSA